MATEKPSKARKLAIGWFTFTCCEGCAIIFVELLNDKFKEWKDQLEFRHCRILQSRNVMKGMDVAIVEGAMSTADDLKKLKQIRKNCRRLVVVGSCAINGMPAALRNNFKADQAAEIRPILKKFGHLPRVEPPTKFVKVDAQVPGCPMGEQMFLQVMDKYLREFGVK